MLREIRPAIVLVIALTLITGVAYPVATWALTETLVPGAANGSLVRDERGAELLQHDGHVRWRTTRIRSMSLMPANGAISPPTP